MRFRFMMFPLVLAFAVGAAGCAAPPVFPVVEPTTAFGDDAEAGGRWYSVPVTAGESAVRIEGAAFMSPYFDTTEGVEVGVDLAAGETATIEVPVGAASCPEGQGATTLQLVLAVDGQEVIQSVVVEGDALAARQTAECGQVSITNAVTPSWGEITASEPLAVQTSLLLVRVSGSEAFTVTAIDGSEQFAITAGDGALPATLPATGQRLEVPVTIEARACDGLPFGGATTAFAFSIEMSAADQDPVRISVRPEGVLLAALEDIATSCDQVG